MPPPCVACGGRGEAVHGHGHGASSCDEYVISYSWGGAVIGVHVSRMRIRNEPRGQMWNDRLHRIIRIMVDVRRGKRSVAGSLLGQTEPLSIQ